MKKRFLALLLLGGAGLSAQTIVQQFTAISKGDRTKSDLDIQATVQGSTLIAMPGQLSPGVKVVSVTDNAPDGPNTYKQVPGAAASSCPEGSLDIWYCENCHPGVTELQFHLSDRVRASINTFLEVAGLAPASPLDGEGAHVDNGTASAAGLEAGPSIKTTGTDFILARFSSAAPYPTGASPEAWTFNPAYIYARNAAPGTYQPTLTGAKAGDKFCMSMAAFKIAPAVATPAADQK